MKRPITTVLLASSMALGANAFAQAAGNTTGQPSTPPQTTPQGSQPGMTAPPAGTSSAADFPKEDLQKFAKIQKPLQDIRTDYSKRVQSEREPEKAAKLQQEASDKMMEVVEKSGLEVETYNQIAMAVQSNPELQAKVQSMMN